MGDIVYNGKCFKLVSSTDDLYTSADADVGRLVDGELKLYTPFVATGGYIRIGHKIPNLTNQRHRLVAMAWKEVPDNYLELEVNHLNHTPGDDWSDNLEWSTGSENINHAVDHGRMGNRPIYYKLGLNGGISHEMSSRRLLSKLGIKDISIGISLKRQSIYRHSNGYIFSYSKKELEDKVSFTSLEIRSYAYVRLYKDGIILNECSSLSKLDKCGHGAIAYRVRKYGSHIGDGYEVKFVVDNIEYDLTSEQIKLKFPKHPIRVFDILTGVESVYPNVTEVGKLFGMDPSILLRRIKTKNISVLTPHHRVTDDADIEFPTTFKFLELIRLVSISFYNPDGVLVTTGNTTREYSENMEKLGYGSKSSIHYNLASHIIRYRDKGYKFVFKIGDKDITDKIYGCFAN